MDDRTETERRADEPARYESDLYGWAVEQAALLRAGRIAEADVLNIAEEIDDVGNEQYDKLESAIRIISMHLLKSDHQAGKRSRSWHLGIAVQRRHAARVLRKNPSLKPHIKEAVADAYEPQGSKPQRRRTSTSVFFRLNVRTRSKTSWSAVSLGRRRAEFFVAGSFSL